MARLATNASELDAAQHLRYQVFYQEMSAVPDEKTRKASRDTDEFDQQCDHLLVVRQTTCLQNDMIAVDGGELVGTYRLLNQKTAEQSTGFYSQREFDLASLIKRKPHHNFLELGRSCVRKAFRTKPAVELLWQGIWNYVRLHKHDVMIGCASLEGVDIEELKAPLSFLHHNFQPPADWQVRAHTKCRLEIDLLASDQINERTAVKMLPPLIKGYLRLGAYIGDGAVIDCQFNTTDVLIILPTSAIDPRYFSRFGRPDDKL